SSYRHAFYPCRGITARNATVQCTTNFHFLCYKSHVFGMYCYIPGTIPDSVLVLLTKRFEKSKTAQGHPLPSSRTSNHSTSKRCAKLHCCGCIWLPPITFIGTHSLTRVETDSAKLCFYV
ncbi:hypothetical protein SFRURICE_018399, partial [Spodoptera frugiperda]